ncbi:MAG: CPBP family intramembrane metalloprotease [Gammaproteobacteria bacterium]|nr:CPBP family intramembrane metalloprotease [Gammaproteobacteria bacterium]
MSTQTSNDRSVARYFILLFGLCIPVWAIGPLYDIELFPGFKLFQAGLAMPMIAALILTYCELGWSGTVALLRRSFDAQQISPKIWFLPILLVYPSIGFINYWVLWLFGVDIPPPTYSLVILLGYCTVFFLACAEELGLSGYALDRLQRRYSALVTGLILGVVWAGYHIPGFLISGYYSTGWIFWHAVFTVVTRVLFVWVYNNSGRSLFAMALFHWTFGLFWMLWPQDNLQKAVPFYSPLIAAMVAMLYVIIVVYIWRPKTLAQSRFKQAKMTPDAFLSANTNHGK